MKSLRIFMRRHSLGELFVYWLDQVAGVTVRWVPGYTGFLVRTLWYKATFRSLPGILLVYPNVVIEHSYGMSVGRNFRVNYGCYFDARGGLQFGDDVLIGPQCVIVSTSHDTTAKSIHDGPRASIAPTLGRVTIGNNVWLGADVTVIGECRIGDHSIVAAGSVVTTDIPEGCLAVGAPARVVRRIE
jgi:acetyltransferase-like isoleucine patch superfamily enzyme